MVFAMDRIEGVSSTNTSLFLLPEEALGEMRSWLSWRTRIRFRSMR